jgi:hypothetical protein
MINPFQYGGVVDKGSFCNRRRELADLTRAMENGERIFVYSERRMGKTSLIHRALSRLPTGRFLSAYVDLWPTDGKASFVAVTSKSITESMATTADRMLLFAKKFFGRLRPSITADAAGNPQIAFGTTETGEPGPELDEVLSAPAKIAAKEKRRIVIAFDEFQRILEYPTDRVERSLRSALQEQRGVSYVFLGSRKHLIQKMFLDQARPLYRAGAHYPLGTIAVKDWMAFIRRRFRTSDKDISADQIRQICLMTGGHPFYTQHLCHALWEITEPGTRVTDESIASAIDLLLDRENYAYTALWESLARNQRRFLIGLAGEPQGVKVYSAAFLQRYHLRSPSNSQRAVEALLDRDVIDRDDGSFIITDRFFKMWIAATDPRS